MKNLLCVLLCFCFVNISCFADDIADVQCFFNEYVSAANNYSCDYFDYYTNNAKIIRVVEKSDGTEEAVNIPLERYKLEAQKTSKLAKLRKYKNKYFNVRIFPYGSDYKVVALRMPSTSDYKIPAYFIIGKDCDGNWKIKEESMNTKVQKFLKRT